MERKDLIESLGITYTAQLVPFSKSRNAKPVTKPGDLSINWKVTLAKGANTLTTDYSAGIGHLPGYKQTWHGRMSVDEFDAIKRACETGKTGKFGTLKIPAPSIEDVLYSLVSDSTAIDAGSFEDWASDYGYDTDSREAERIYKQCIDIGLALRRVVGDAKLQELREAFQDY